MIPKILLQIKLTEYKNYYIKLNELFKTKIVLKNDRKFGKIYHSIPQYLIP